MTASFADTLSRKLAALARQQRFSGAVLVRQGETDLFRRAYGFANRTWGVKNRPETRFRIASVGKLFTAAAILQLIEAGKLTLETRLPERLGLEGTKIPADVTVYQLLTMTSGIADWSDEESENFEAEWAQLCRQHPLYLLRRDSDYLPIFAQQEPYDPPGQKFHYNGAGFMLLGLLIEKISGQTYFDYVRQHIFAPAGMADSDFLDLDDVAPRVAEGYLPIEDENERIAGWKKNYYAATAGPAADGGATSTLDDLARFVQALRQGKLMAPELARTLYSPQVIESEEEYLGFRWRYGFGCYLLLDRDNHTVRWGHTGEEDGVSCRLWRYPRQNVDVVILGNQSSCAGKVSTAIQKLVLAL
jgi:CubicO group peptidase (beta-lactamase class C family)